MTSTQERVAELDGLRGLAVCMVLLWHFVGSMVYEPRWLAQIMQFLTIFGRTGVDLFFVLSGYLIVGILLDNRDAPNVVRVFYWRRFLRIWPPYILLIAAYWACYSAVGESAGFNTNGGFTVQFLAQLLFGWNWLMAFVDGPVARGFSVTWSVAIEEWFYILVPWFLLATPATKVPRFLLTLCVLSVVGRAIAYMSLGDHLAPYILMPFRMDGLCVGGLLAWAIRNPDLTSCFERNKLVVERLTLCFAIVAPVFVALSKGNLDRNMYLFGHTFLSVGFVIVLLWTIQNPNTAQTRFLRSDLLRRAGWYSYTLYLFHPLFISLYFQMAGRNERILSLDDALLALAALLSSIAFAALSFSVMERPLSKLGHRYKYVEECRKGGASQDDNGVKSSDRGAVA